MIVNLCPAKFRFPPGNCHSPEPGERQLPAIVVRGTHSGKQVRHRDTDEESARDGPVPARSDPPSETALRRRKTAAAPDLAGERETARFRSVLGDRDQCCLCITVVVAKASSGLVQSDGQGNVPNPASPKAHASGAGNQFSNAYWLARHRRTRRVHANRKKTGSQLILFFGGVVCMRIDRFV